MIIDQDNDSYPFLKSLNQPQREAVLHIHGPLLALAGAGTGKTKVLTSRIANLIVSGNAFPREILAVTFTNKAAREMQNRVNSLVPASGLWLGTFHSIAAKILRNHPELVGLTSSFTIIDYDDQIRLVKNLCKENNIDDKKYPPKLLLNIIQKWKDLGLDFNSVSSSDVTSHAHSIAKNLYSTYQNKLLNLNVCDFGDLLLYNLQIFKNNTDLLRDYQDKFKFLLVDEYQDTNISQYLWLRMLAQKHKNICCVGDDDQSIYGWRGAEVGNILRFEKDFLNSKIIRLEQNYRSTNNILKTASTLIANNRGRFGKTLWTEFGEGEKIKFLSLWDEREEANYIAKTIKNYVSVGKFDLKEIAILVRATAQTRVIEESFVGNSIPYQVIGGLRFYERMEIRDIISYIRLTVQPRDNLAFERIINVPKRSVGASTLRQIQDYATLNQISLFDALRCLIEEGGLKGKALENLSILYKSLERWKELFETMEHHKVVEHILNESGYLNMLQLEKTPEAEGRVENLKELVKALQEFATIEDFLDHVSLVSELENNNNSNLVSVMTLHSAKGLEFDLVFLPGWEEGIFPHQKALEENGIAGIEEERRLAYVGITRAKKELFILSAMNRRLHGMWQNNVVSRFVEELPKETVETIKLSNGLYFNSNKNYNLEEKAKTFISTATNANGFRTGDQVHHKKFGSGCIIKIQGNHLDIAFKEHGIKKLMDDFVTKL